MSLRARLTLALAALVLLIPGCGDGQLSVGKIAPDFRAEDLNGRTVFLNAELTRPVVLTFFASWCGPCRREMPLMVELSQRFADKAAVLCVVTDPENNDSVRALANELKVPYPMLLDEGREIMNAYRIQALPTTMLLRPDGRIVALYYGFSEQDAQTLTLLIQEMTAGR